MNTGLVCYLDPVFGYPLYISCRWICSFLHLVERKLFGFSQQKWNRLIFVWLEMALFTGSIQSPWQWKTNNIPCFEELPWLSWWQKSLVLKSFYQTDGPHFNVERYEDINLNSLYKSSKEVTCTVTPIVIRHKSCLTDNIWYCINFLLLTISSGQHFE